MGGWLQSSMVSARDELLPYFLGFAKESKQRKATLCGGSLRELLSQSCIFWRMMELASLKHHHACFQKLRHLLNALEGNPLGLHKALCAQENAGVDFDAPATLTLSRQRQERGIFICPKRGFPKWIAPILFTLFLWCAVLKKTVWQGINAPAQTRFATACGWRWRVLARLLWGIARALHSGGRGVAGGAARGRHGRRHAPVAGR